MSGALVTIGLVLGVGGEALAPANSPLLATPLVTLVMKARRTGLSSGASVVALMRSWLCSVSNFLETTCSGFNA